MLGRPGGGAEPGEPLAEDAAPELAEETGVLLALPCLVDDRGGREVLARRPPG